MAKILVADDEIDLETLIKQKFRKQIREEKYEFIFAMNGNDALLKLEQHPDVSMVLSDINMPEMGGLECLSLLKKMELVKDIPVLMFTTSSSKQDVKAASDLGALCFVTKPDKFQHLKIIIKTVLTHLEIQQLDTLCEAIYKNRQSVK